MTPGLKLMKGVLIFDRTPYKWASSNATIHNINNVISDFHTFLFLFIKVFSFGSVICHSSLNPLPVSFLLLLPFVYLNFPSFCPISPFRFRSRPSSLHHLNSLPYNSGQYMPLITLSHTNHFIACITHCGHYPSWPAVPQAKTSPSSRSPISLTTIITTVVASCCLFLRRCLEPFAS